MFITLNMVAAGGGGAAGGSGGGVGVSSVAVSGSAVVSCPAPASLSPPPHPGRLVIAAPQASAEPVSSSFRLVFEMFDWSLESGVF